MTGDVVAQAAAVPPEWAETVLLLRSWRRDFTEADFIGYRLILGRFFTPSVVEQALARLARSDRRFFPMPTAQQIANECDLILHPEFAPVGWEELYGAFTAARRSRFFPKRGTPDEKAVFVGDTVANELGPIAGAFAASIHTRAAKLPLDDPQYGGHAVDRLRADWAEHQTNTRDRVLAGGVVLTPAEIVRRDARVAVLTTSQAQRQAQIEAGR